MNLKLTKKDKAYIASHYRNKLKRIKALGQEHATPESTKLIAETMRKLPHDRS